MNSLLIDFVCYCSDLRNVIVTDSYIHGLNFTAFRFFFVALYFFNNIQFVVVIRKWYCFMLKVI